MTNNLSIDILNAMYDHLMKEFMAQREEVIRLKKDLDEAIREGEIFKVVCKCGKYCYYHQNGDIKDKGFTIDWDRWEAEADSGYTGPGICNECMTGQLTD